MGHYDCMDCNQISMGSIEARQHERRTTHAVAYRPGTRCPNCGVSGERQGHMDCQYPHEAR